MLKDGLGRKSLEWLDRHAWLLVPFYLAGMVAIVLPWALRQLWYDELFTYYVSASHSLDQAIQRMLHVDLNPPLSYLLVALSLRVFGDTPLAVRLPFLLGFLVASLAVFAFVRRRAGGLFGLTAMVLTWSCGFLGCAAQARPYALVLASMMLALLCWSRIQPGARFSRWHWGLSASLGAMLLSHCLALWCLLPFYLAETVRAWRSRRLDRATWLALLLPLPVVLAYIPLLARAHTMIYPLGFLPSWPKAWAFYSDLLVVQPGPAIWMPLLALLLLPARGGTQRVLPVHEAVFVMATLLAPLPVMLGLAWGRTAFWPRYGICAAVAFGIGAACLVARKTNRSLVAAALAALVCTAAFSFEFASFTISNWRRPPVYSTLYRDLHPELPFVAASGLAFLEMDHREPPEFVHRLYYLTDREAAIRYAHATIFEGLPVLCRYFPVRATVTPYRSFLPAHERFLVLATPDWPEDWLLKKLRDDGAEIRRLAEIDSGYRDRVLYEVRRPAPDSRAGP